MATALNDSDLTFQLFSEARHTTKPLDTVEFKMVDAFGFLFKITGYEIWNCIKQTNNEPRERSFHIIDTEISSRKKDYVKMIRKMH